MVVGLSGEGERMRQLRSEEREGDRSNVCIIGI